MRPGSIRTPPASGDHSATTPPRPRVVRRGRLLGVGAVLVLGLWVVVAAVLVLRATGGLERAEALLPTAREAFATADVDAATSALEEAREELSDASSALDNPLVIPFRAVPVFGADLRAITAVTVGSAGVADAAMEAVTTLNGLPGGLSALGPIDGVLPVAAIEALARPLRRTADTTLSAVDAIEGAPGSGRVARVTAGRERVLELLEPAAIQAETAAQLTEQLPGFLGADGPRTYLFGASTPAELRGTGGFIGSVSLLRIDDGVPDFGSFRAASDLTLLAPDALPAPVAEDAGRWRRYGGTGHWVMLNRTPHFPAAARAMMQHWAETEGETVDGLIVADPYALQALLELAGPAQVPGYGVELDADSVVDFIANEAYGLFESEDERKEILGAVSAATLEGFLESGRETTPTVGLLETFAGLATGGHVVAFAEDAEVQSAFSRAGVAGELRDTDGDLVNVVANSGSATKIDYYAQRRLDHEVTLLSGGAARSELSVTLENHAPTSGQPNYIIGPNNPNLVAGESLLDVSVYLAKGAEFTAVPPAGEGWPAFTETELGHPVHDGWVPIPSGQQVERSYGWRTADAWSTTADGILEYEVLFQGQTVIRPTEFNLQVNIPAGFEVVDEPDGARTEGNALTWSGEIRGEDIALRVRLRPESNL